MADQVELWSDKLQVRLQKLFSSLDRDQQGQLILICPNCRQVTPVPANGVASLQPAFNTNRLLDILSEHKKAKEGALNCADHQERELELYCESCEQLICLKCTITQHNGHNYNLVKDVFQKHKLEIVASLAPAKEQLAAISKASEQVNSRKRLILDQQVTLEANIHLDGRQLIDAISARTQELVSKLQHITEEKSGHGGGDPCNRSPGQGSEHEDSHH